ncbi:hypothetical protein NFI96_018059, partial [Prochilodus magdalenae]
MVKRAEAIDSQTSIKNEEYGKTEIVILIVPTLRSNYPLLQSFDVGKTAPTPSTPPTVRIVHSGHACNVEEERYTERVYTIREGETLELTCLVTGHPRPQMRQQGGRRAISLDPASAFQTTGAPLRTPWKVFIRGRTLMRLPFPILSPIPHTFSLRTLCNVTRALWIRWTKTAGSVSDRFQDSSVFNETLHIAKIQRHQGGRYYCKAENGLGSPAIKSIRVDVYCVRQDLDDPVVTVHQSIGEAKEQFYYERTVFLRCVANSNPPVRYSWHRGRDVLSQGSDKGVEIYEPFFTQGETKILKLKNLRPKDYANYSCIASVRNVCGIPDRRVIFRLTNKTGVKASAFENADCSSSLGSAASPSIKLLVEDPIVVNPGQTVSLVCIATGGEPPPTLTWSSSSEKLPEKSVVKDGTLTLPAITSEDAGVYSCIASNNVGNPAKKSTTIIVRALKKGRFWITPDPYHNDDNIQIGREVKISCQVEATPPEELLFSWLKNGRALRSSERMVITQTDPDISPGTTNLDIIDLKFTDFGTYTCVASLRGGGIPEISIDVNISSTTAVQLRKKSLTLSSALKSQKRYSPISVPPLFFSFLVPPNLTVPRGKSPLVVREGETVELECLVSGKPKPIILWSRADKEVPMPDGSMQMESYDGVLRIVNVSREMTGSYRCQTSQYNGFNVKPREAVVELIVQYPPAVEPVWSEVRQGLNRPVAMNCRVLRAHPSRVLRYEWRLGSRLLHAGHFDTRDETEYTVRTLTREGYGEYTCDIINEAGAGRCTFLVTVLYWLWQTPDGIEMALLSACRGKAYAPEFYYDTYSPLWQNRPRVYGYKLQWTQMNPDAVDRIMAYRLGIRQTGQQRWWEQEIPVEGPIQKGELITYNLTELIRPEAYEVRLTPITRFGEGDSTIRMVTYSGEFQCGFEEEPICMFTQDKNDNFDWTRHSAATRDTKYTPNTGPSGDRSGSKQGFYMYIETSRPRKEGDKARLLSPTFNVAPKNPYGITNPPAYCFGFYYHMYGKHIGDTDELTLAYDLESRGHYNNSESASSVSYKSLYCSYGTLNAFMKQKGQATSDAGPVWSLSGNQGDRWRQAKISIHPTSSFQVIFEGIRGPGIEGDIAIDDVTLEEGECPDPPSNRMYQICIAISFIGVDISQSSSDTEVLKTLAALLCLIHSHQHNTHYHTTTTYQIQGPIQSDTYMAVMHRPGFHMVSRSEVTTWLGGDWRQHPTWEIVIHPQTTYPNRTRGSGPLPYGRLPACCNKQ